LGKAGARPDNSFHMFLPFRKCPDINNMNKKESSIIPMVIEFLNTALSFQKFPR